MQIRLLLATLALSATATAQTTWIVNAGGGPGVSFTDLPTAVAAAASGDTIIVQTGPQGQGATAFSTSKGLTILGEGGEVPISTSAANPISIDHVPFGEAFRMVGFSRASNGNLNFDIFACAGEVHLERLKAREPGFIFPAGPSVKIDTSPHVTLRELITFGAPAVQVDNSFVTLAGCQLGLTEIGLGGGQAVGGNQATITIVEPRFDAGFGAAASIAVTNAQLTIAGGSTAQLINFGGDVVQAQGGQVTLDPDVVLTPAPGFQPVSGTAPVSTILVPATWTTNIQPGQPATLSTKAAPGALVLLAVGLPARATATPFGNLGLDTLAPITYLPAFASPTSGLTQTAVTVPASVPVGSAFALQAVVITPLAIELGLPTTIVAL